MRPLLGAAPCCAGEDLDLYIQIFNLHIVAWNPPGLREWQAVKRLADCDWGCLRFGQAKTWGLNAVIARSLLARIIRERAENELARLATEQKLLENGDPSIEMQLLTIFSFLATNRAHGGFGRSGGDRKG